MLQEQTKAREMARRMNDSEQRGKREDKPALKLNIWGFRVAVV
jgi:hypothetical protein